MDYENRRGFFKSHAGLGTMRSMDFATDADKAATFCVQACKVIQGDEARTQRSTQAWQHAQPTCAPAQVFEVQDAAAHNIFCRCPAVTSSLSVRFYAGVLLRTPDGTPLGTLCVLDVKPRTLTDSQRSTLVETSKKTMALLNAHRQAAPSRAAPVDPARASACAEAVSVPGGGDHTPPGESAVPGRKAWLALDSPAGVALLFALIFVLAFMAF